MCYLCGLTPLEARVPHTPINVILVGFETSSALQVVA